MSTVSGSKLTFSRHKFCVLFAMQKAMGIGYHVSTNQVPASHNGGRAKFKINRRFQMKHGFKAKH